MDPRGRSSQAAWLAGAGITRRRFVQFAAASGLALTGSGALAACTRGEEGNGQPKGPLTVTYMSAGTYDVAAKDLAPQFRERYGVEVTVAAFPWTTLLRNNANDLLTGVGRYDVLSGVAAQQWNQLAPLDTYIERDNYQQPFIEGLVDKMPSVGESLVALPYGPDSYAMAVRTDLLEQAGVDFAPGGAWTWDEFDANLEKLDAAYQNRGISAFVLAAGAVDQLAPFFWGRYDGYHFTSDRTMRHDEARAVDALRRLQRHLGHGPDNVRGLSIDEAAAVFLDGRACILECWPSFTRGQASDPAKSKVVGKWAFLPYPTPGFDYLAVWHLGVSQLSENKDHAWDWIKFYINRENDKAFFIKHGIGPAMTPTYQDPELAKNYANDFPAILANLTRANQPVVTDEAELFLGQTVSEVISGGTSSERGIEKVNTKWASLSPTNPEFELAKRQDLVG